MMIKHELDQAAIRERMRGRTVAYDNTKEFRCYGHNCDKLTDGRYSLHGDLCITCAIKTSQREPNVWGKEI